MTAAEGIEIGAASESDLDQILELWGAARSRYSTTPDTRDVLLRLLDRDPGALLVAREGGRLLGMLIAAWDGWRGNMYRLAVAHEHRRRGIGLALVRAGERRLWDRGACRVTALVGAEDEDAVALWRAAGYEHDRLVSRFVKNLSGP